VPIPDAGRDYMARLPRVGVGVVGDGVRDADGDGLGRLAFDWESLPLGVLARLAARY